MRARTGALAFLSGGIMALAMAPEVFSQPAPSTAAKPLWVYAHDLRVRKGGEKDFTPATPKMGVEFFRDDATGAIIGISQAGFLSVTAAGTLGNEKKAQWLFAHDLRARKSDEEKFTKDTTKYGIEVFKDTASGKLIYVDEKAAIAFGTPPATVASDKDPAWHHALVLKVRGPNEKAFTDKTKKFGLEVFKDGNTGNLIYLTDAGDISIAPAPASAPDPKNIKTPTVQYGLELRVRRADEADFTPATKKFGVEVFKDENTGGLVYISETGSIATAPMPAKLTTGQDVTWKHAMALKARPGGVADFTKAAKYGVEVFQDNNSGHLIYISETGAIAVLAK
jgi:hypothetical protein